MLIRETVCSAWVKRGPVVVALFLAMLAAARPAVASSIYIDFGSYSLAPSSLFGAAAGSGSWNHVTLLGTTAGLFDILGNPTGAAITISADSMDGTGGPGSTDAARLMHDNFFSANGHAWTISLSGLADGIYDLYLYDPTNRAVGTGSGVVNGLGFSSVNGAFSGGFTAGVDYSLLSNVAVKGGILAATGAEAGSLSGLAGLQLVERQIDPTTVPEPGTLVLFGAAVLSIAGHRRRPGRTGA